ncbi:nucleoside diphosphate kinase regulator [Azonexus sp. IMCC34842]|uniref:nucleoside diphosphate kinase regulator n=1 Tax=Azonexus sp. IMCC34842 TaxID=3420950 RepID=UPI003D11A69E
MIKINIAMTQNFPRESEYSGPPVVCSADYVRLRQYPLSDELAEELDRAIVVEREQVPMDVVTMHTRCTYIDQGIGTQREIELVFPDEADPAMGKISVLTPVGSALIGLRVGQEIAWEFPDGSMRRLKVASVTQSAG